MANIRVMSFGLGPIGAAVARQVANRPGFKIVGAVDSDPSMTGRDLADVIGLTRRVGVRVDEEVRGLVMAGYETARQIIGKHRKAVRAMADELLAVESLDAEEIKTVIAAAAA